jgi:hypothetical protein
MASRKQVVPMNNDGSTTTTVAENEWNPDTTTPENAGEGQGTESVQYQAYMQEKLDRAFALLKNMDLKKRKEVLNFLRSKGINSDYEVSFSGLETPDLYRYREFLIYAEVSDLTPDKAMKNIGNLPSVAVSEGAKRKTNIKDVDAVFTEVVQSMVGRQPTKQELEKFRTAYSGMEAGGNAPNLQVAAQSQLKETMPEETKAAQFADYATVFEQMLRGG